MLPTNVMSFMKKMVSNTEAMNANQFIGANQSSSGTGGAIGRLRQTLQQAQESVSNRLTQTRSGYQPQPLDQQGYESNTTADSQQNVPQTSTPNSEEKENQEAARPGDAGRCRVCVKAMKPDEYFKECTECGLRVCDDCASYSHNADGNTEVSWRCSVCRRRGVAIIARRVQPGIEQSEVLEGLGCETTIRKSPDARRLQNSGRADSETEVLLLAPKPSDVRRHSDVPLRDIAKFQAISAAASQHDLGLAVSMPGEKAKSSTDIILSKNDNSSSIGPNISISTPAGVSVSITTPFDRKGGGNAGKDKVAPAKSPGKAAPVKRQRSYERGASEGALNLPANARGRRASCDMRGVDASSILNNNTIQSRVEKGGGGGEKPAGIPGLSEKDLQRLQHQHQQHIQQQQQPPHTQPQQQQQHNQPPQQKQQQQQHNQPQQQKPPQQQQHNQPQQQQKQYQSQQQYQQQQQQQPQQQYQQQYQQQPQQFQHNQQQFQHNQTQPQQQFQHNQPQQQPFQHNQQQYQQQQMQYQQQQAMQGGQQMGQNHPRGKAPPSDLAIGNDMRRRSVQIYNTTQKQATTPRSCASLDAEALEMKQKQLQQQQNVQSNDIVKRQGSSTDGEAIKIVIDDVDSTAAKSDNNKGQSMVGGGADSSEFRTRVIRLRRDPQDRGYQTRGYGLRVVGGCSSPGNPGNLRARVARVTPGSGADFAGIRRGDVVLTWNSVKLSNMTFEEVCKVLDTSADTAELTLASLDSDSIATSVVPENEPTQDWESENAPPEAESLSVNTGADQFTATSPSGRRQLPRLPAEGRIQLRLFHDEVHNTLEISVANIAFGNEDCTTIDLNDIIITLRIGEKLANTRWNQCVLFTKVSPEDLFDSWLVLELQRGPDFLGECHVDMGRVSLDDRPVWFPFSAKGSSSHRGSISQIVSPGGNTPPSARELARRLRMRMAAGSQSQSEEQDDSSGQSSPCATSLLRPEVAWEMLGTLGPPSANLTSRSAPTSRRGSAQSDRGAMGIDGVGEEGRGSAPSTPALPRSLPPSRRGSFAFAVEQVINQSRRSDFDGGGLGSVAFQQRVPDMFMRQLPLIPAEGMDPAMLRNRRNSAWNPREVGYDRRSQFERTDSLRAMTNQPRRTSEAAQSFRDVVFQARATLNMQPKRPDPEESWRQQQWAPQ